MKKLVIFLVLSFLVTGCSATYDIEIYNDTVKEEMNFLEFDSTKWDSTVQYGLSYRDLLLASREYPYPVFYDTIVDENDRIYLDGVEYYDNTLISDPYQLGQRLSYPNFTLTNFSSSSLVRKCYQYFQVSEEEEQIRISTSLKNLCFQEYPLLDEITIHLKTNHKVVNHNANQVNGYHYTWNIKRENQENSPISITLKKDEYVFNYENEFMKKMIYIAVIIGIILSVGGVTYVIFQRKRNHVNEI